VTLTTPAENSGTIIGSGGSLSISANNTAGNASYISKWDHFKHQWSYFSYFNHTNITVQNYELQVTQGATVVTKKNSVL
jgi:hypothetical protein